VDTMDNHLASPAGVFYQSVARIDYCFFIVPSTALSLSTNPHHFWKGPRDMPISLRGAIKCKHRFAINGKKSGLSPTIMKSGYNHVRKLRRVPI
jgi:hypothetical protein